VQARTILGAVAAILVAAGAAQAGTVQYAIPSDGTIVHSYYWEKDGEYGTVTDRLAATWWTPGWPGITANFSQDKVLEVTFAAPEGKAFQFTKPSGLDSAGISFELDSDGSTGYPYEDGDVTMEWLGLRGTEPSSTTTTNTWGVGTQTVWLQSNATATDSFSFTGFKVTFTVPAGFTANWQDLPIFNGNVTISADSSGWTTDPGQMMTLVAVPEPATMGTALLAIGSLGAFIRKRPRKEATA